MSDSLSSFLTGAATPELKISIERAMEMFVALQLDEDYLQHLNQILAAGDSQDDVLAEVYNYIRNTQREAINAHAVFVTEEADIDFCNELIHGLLTLVQYEDSDAVLGFCNANEFGSTESFANLMALVTTLSVDEVLLNILSVSDKLIGAVRTEREIGFLFHMLAQEGSSMQEAQPYVEKLLRFTAGLVDPKLRVVTLLKEGRSIGEPFANYADTFGRDIEALTVERAADELVACALVSCDGTNTPQETIRVHLEKYVADAGKASQIDMRVTQIMLRLTR